MKRVNRDSRQLILPLNDGKIVASLLVEKAIVTTAPKLPCKEDVPLLQKAVENNRYHLYYADYEHAKDLLNVLNYSLIKPERFEARDTAFIETLREKAAEVKRNPFADHRNPQGFRASYIARLAKLEKEAKQVK